MNKAIAGWNRSIRRATGLISAIATVASTSACAREDQKMAVEEFVLQYESALASQSWDQVGPLVHEDASVIFSDGSIHKGKEAVRVAFERNFRSIVDEDYRISNVHWLLRTDEAAVYMFDFDWSGKSVGDGRAISGSGRGTAVLSKDGHVWKLLAEQLTRK